MTLSKSRKKVDRRIGGLERLCAPFSTFRYVDRRIGGLEMTNTEYQETSCVDRRIGGLEIKNVAYENLDSVDRRIGGLENNGSNISKVKYRSLSRVSGGDPARLLATS